MNPRHRKNLKSSSRTQKRHSPPSERMKPGELYVVYSGFDGDGLHLLSYGDPKRSPRIYKRGAVDDRLTSLPICRNMATAKRMLKGETYAVFLPLSEMIRIFREREVKSWASAQGHVTPAEVREYVSRFASGRNAA